MEYKYNVIEGSISFCKKDYDTEKGFWEAIGDQVRLLTNGPYVAIVRYEAHDIYCVDYIYARAEENDYQDMIRVYNEYIAAEQNINDEV